MKVAVSLMALGMLFLFFNGRMAHAQQIKYVNETEVGVLWTTANLVSPVALSIQSYNAVEFSGYNYMSIGATVGYDEYFDFSVLPLSLGWRGILPLEKRSLYLGLEVGYGFTWLEKNTGAERYDGGMMVNPHVGWRWKPKGKEQDRYLISLGYKRQTVTRHAANQWYGPGSYETEKFRMNRMSVRLGMIF